MTTFIPTNMQGSGRAARSARTVIVSGVPAGLLSKDVVADILHMHFQKRKNNGGDVEQVVYPTVEKGVARITFEDPEDVENVLKKDEHQLKDKRLPGCYPLKVTRYCGAVFNCVFSLLNMSVFKDEFDLEDLIQELKKNIPALSFGRLQSDGHISVEGPFPAIKLLKDFLLLKAKSLSEKDKREQNKSHQRPKRSLRQQRLSMETSNSIPDADGGKQVLILDTDIYHYMKHFFFKKLLVNYDVVISDDIEGEITTLYIRNARSRSGTEQVLRVKEEIENESVKLHNSLRKERICFEGYMGDEKQKYKQACETVKSHYPAVLVIPYDTHIDIIGNSSLTFKFTREVRRKIGSQKSKLERSCSYGCCK
ncbi:RNA-binding protein 43 [Nothoprocta perdicaria]|uniref:RNA-binding protein 43 n=1 Tax=Nothoprocta perdicaria TaxID=30464 RepID=UPI000E1BE631|nr:RNA-binding protein 43 [Nothoprocta perdicaria]